MELEPQTPSPPPPPPPPPPTASSLSSTVDTSRAFSSVKEAVAVFGQKLLAQGLIRSSSPYSYQNSPVGKFSPKSNVTEESEPGDQNDQNTLAHAVKRLGAELEASKTETEENEPGDQKLLAQGFIRSSSPYSYQNSPVWKFSPKSNITEKNEPGDQNDQNTFAHAVKRLETELEATKAETAENEPGDQNDRNTLAHAVKRREAELLEATKTETEENEPGDQNDQRTLAHAVKRREAELEATKTETEKNEPGDQNDLTHAVKWREAELEATKMETERNEPGDQNDQRTLADAVKRLEAELEATKMELKLLKEREEETEVAVASLNAELHKNMSKIARGEADEAAKAAAVAKTESIRERQRRMEEYLPTLAQILGDGGGEKKEEREKVVKKKKPIVPLVWELFSRRKGSPSDDSLHSSLFSSPHLYWN